LKNIARYLLGGLILAAGVLTVSYLQYRFDQSDIRNAVNAVRSTRSGGPQQGSLEERLSQRFGIAPESISWQPRIESKLKGTVQVRALLPQGPNDLIWEVDLVRYSVQPVTESAKTISKFQD